MCLSSATALTTTAAMSNNTIRPVLGAGRSVLGAPIQASSWQRRCFSATAPNQRTSIPPKQPSRRLHVLTPFIVGNVITFSKASNETLDNILRELSHKVILPSYLPVSQRKKIFRTRWKAKLELEPIEIEVNERKFRFRHIDKVPNAKKEFFKAMDHMQTKDDWQKLPKLLEALWWHAQRKFEPGDWPRIIRKAGQTGNLGPIFEACQNPARTGIKLDNSENVQEFMSAIVWQTTDAEWSLKATAAGARAAEKVVGLLHEAGHQHTGQAKADFDSTGQFPLKRDPQVMATPVLFAAAMIVKHGKREEYMPMLKKYGGVMLERWPENKGLLELHPHTAYIDPKGMEYLMEKGKFLIVASPILKGFDLAIEALGDDPMAQAIKSRRDAVADEVQSALASKEPKNHRGEQMYERIFPEHQAPKPEVAQKAAA